MMNDVDKIKHELEKCAWFNGGRGLLLTPTLIKGLRKLGIDGPYAEQGTLPPVGGN